VAPIPEPSEYLVDQYLVAAELMGIKATIAFNKVDLLSTEMFEQFRVRLARYVDIG
jgi:ribosome biogenesis GTPase